MQKYIEVQNAQTAQLIRDYNALREALTEAPNSDRRAWVRERMGELAARIKYLSPLRMGERVVNIQGLSERQYRVSDIIILRLPLDDRKPVRFGYMGVPAKSSARKPAAVRLRRFFKI